MTRRRFLGRAAGMGAGLMLSPRAAAGLRAALPERPNVVLILTDDQGYGEIGRHGNPILRTPHLDRMHDAAIHFDRFHVSPTCSPTRAALLTGRHEFRSGVSHTIRGRSLLRPGGATIASVLAGAGYDTGLFGKWHLGDNYPCRPHDNGFQTALYHGGGGITQTPDWFGNSYFSPTLFRNGVPERSDGYCTDVFFSAALEWIGARRDRPFFCYLPTNAPHSPLQVPERYADLYRDAPIDDHAKRYYGMITNLDENVGRLFARLAEWGLAQRTLVIFLGDNGSAEAGNPARGLFNAGQRGGKGSVWEGGTRVPSFWHLPAFGPGRGVDRLTSGLDVLPTLAELCGAPLPDAELDGRSLVPLLTAPDAAWPDRTLVTHVGRWEPDQDPDAFRLQRCSVRSERFRWVPDEALYDLGEDPGETTNVIGRHRAEADRLAAHYERWWREVLPSLREPVRIGLGGGENPSRLTCHDWHASTVSDDPRQRLLPVWQQDVLRQAAAGRGWRVGEQTVWGAMGSWAVNVEQAGRYELTLRKLPAHLPEGPRRLAAGTAHGLCGAVTAESPVADGATESTLSLNLPAGPAMLECWFTGQLPDGEPSGAFFVDVRRGP